VSGDDKELEMQKPILLAIVFGVCALEAGVSHAADKEAPSQLCVVWSSGDPGVAKNVCFMYTLNAKNRGWFDVVHLVVWGPSAKLLTENEELQKELKDMQDVGVIVEACVACANNYGAADDLRSLSIDVKPMGVPLSDRLKAHWKVLTF
jgi:hypothetical protein